MIGDLILFLFWQHEGEAKNDVGGASITRRGEFRIGGIEM